MKNRGGEKRGGRSLRLIGPALVIAAAAAGAAWSLYAAMAGAPARHEGYACVMRGQETVLTAATGAAGAAGPDLCSNAVRYIVGRKMDLNTATEADLDLLPGIGPKTARRIVEYRGERGGSMRRADLGGVPDLGREARVSLETWTDVK